MLWIMDISTRVNELIQNGKAFCLATVITSDSAGIAPGQKVIVHDTGQLEGDLVTTGRWIQQLRPGPWRRSTKKRVV